MTCGSCSSLLPSPAALSYFSRAQEDGGAAPSPRPCSWSSPPLPVNPLACQAQQLTAVEELGHGKDGECSGGGAQGPRRRPHLSLFSPTSSSLAPALPPANLAVSSRCWRGDFPCSALFPLRLLPRQLAGRAAIVVWQARKGRPGRIWPLRLPASPPTPMRMAHVEYKRPADSARLRGVRRRRGRESCLRMVGRRRRCWMWPDAGGFDRPWMDSTGRRWRLGGRREDRGADGFVEMVQG
uniref:Uncharacterized protein n=1 Tax=Setaria viridis TaxID=4556 RepID=A0A4U6U915_SETVI|nr:hypothetical protein SEVIR_6G135454v2 [Setaria viridis]